MCKNTVSRFILWRNDLLLVGLFFQNGYMNIEQLLVQYFYIAKKVSLEQVGHFTLNDDLVIDFESEKPVQLPADSIHFVYDKTARQDDGFVEYITQQTRKIKPLAIADLESFTQLSRQFINIGKPMHIIGLGTLQRANEAYTFVQSTMLHAKHETATVVVPEKERDEVSFKTEAPKKSNSKGILIGLMAAVFLAALVVLYFVFIKNNAAEQQTAQVGNSITDEPFRQDTAPAMDTTVAAPPVPANITSAPAADGSTFKIVIKTYPTLTAATAAKTRLESYGHTIVMQQVDSTHYTLAIPFTTPLGDTLRVRDSLSKFFNSKATVQL